MFGQSPVLPEGSYGFKGHLDVFQKENGVKENANQGYEGYEATSNNSSVTLCPQSELGGRHASQVQPRGEQRKHNSRLQHLLESIPTRPALGCRAPRSY
ncbi:hypothetical protein L1049_020815 [Liquidambar formosana]|uniref:Uncharacterized protein n=1 Tax=Liquidambar formosana TaxID=63359 RepID=A0AAP0SDL9_LIQFO